MRIGHKTRLSKLERKQQGKRRVNRLALEYEVDAKGQPTSPEVAAWLSAPLTQGQKTRLRACCMAWMAS